MKKLLSLPPNLVGCFHAITGYDPCEWFCSHDPIGKKLGSGGGSVWLLEEAYRDTGEGLTFSEWLSKDKRVILHAGGQSRRLPSYATVGKILTPIPIYRWERGQRLSQNLLQLQMPLCEQLMEAAPASMQTMIVSGDVLIRTTRPLPELPEADVVCLGLWLDADVAKNHGVFICDRKSPTELKYMLQKPSVEEINRLQRDNLFLTDIGIWMLSQRATEVLVNKSKDADNIKQYDLYSDFGTALGSNPTNEDKEIQQLTVAIVPLDGGEFYHFGTSREIISSTLRLQNVVSDQREIIHHSLKPHPSMFVQNSQTWIKITEKNHNLWIENSTVSEDWSISHDNIITGVPDNAWKININEGQCVDIIPIGESDWAVRPYGFHDAFRGEIGSNATMFLSRPLREWASERHIDSRQIGDDATDIQSGKLFPIVKNVHDMGLVLRWMLNEPLQDGGRMLWENSERLSADDISNRANLTRLEQQRKENRHLNWAFLATNYQHSVFYQTDLADASHEFAEGNIPLPHPIDNEEPMMVRIHDAMFRSEWAAQKLKKNFDILPDKGLTANLLQEKQSLEEIRKTQAERAFSLLSEGIIKSVTAGKEQPRMKVRGDQMVWGRSPVRIDIAGGWTDTPPYSLIEGGRVINFAVNLNGQQPIQTFIKPTPERHIIIRSIDLGATERIETYEQLAEYNKVGSPFSIPKAALALAGFLPAENILSRYSSLKEQLDDFGCGMEITLLSAIPAGSGLGTSSILAATVLGTLSDFCGLGWDKTMIGERTLALEQMLTTGGGWQDQFGGLLEGIKMLETQRGFRQQPLVRYLPEHIFTNTDFAPCHLLYYTGITRTAKQILAQIVRRMFLNHGEQLRLLRQMKDHTLRMYDAIQQGDFEKTGRLVRKTWQQNQLLDSGTNPEAILALTKQIDDYCLGYKLPGAGGGGYLYMIAKDEAAAKRIRQTLTAHPQNKNARFVEMTINKEGLQCSRS